MSVALLSYQNISKMKRAISQSKVIKKEFNLYKQNINKSYEVFSKWLKWIKLYSELIQLYYVYRKEIIKYSI